MRHSDTFVNTEIMTNCTIMTAPVHGVFEYVPISVCLRGDNFGLSNGREIRIKSEYSRLNKNNPGVSCVYSKAVLC